MYGLVIESIVAYIRKNYGDEKWLEIRRAAKIEQHSFSTHLVYPETTIPRIVDSTADLLDIPRDELLTEIGHFFVTFVSQYGYDKILRVLGRHMRDFLNGLDNLHEYMRFSYPKVAELVRSAVTHTLARYAQVSIQTDRGIFRAGLTGVNPEFVHWWTIDRANKNLYIVTHPEAQNPRYFVKIRVKLTKSEPPGMEVYLSLVEFSGGEPFEKGTRVFAKLKPPSFFVEKETEHGLVLHYRSKRRYGGYVRYVMGQIKSVGSSFYGLDIDIEVLREEFVGSTVHVTMQLRFDNTAFLTDGPTAQDVLMDDMRIDSEMFFEAFPFHIVFTEDMIIKSIGHGLSNVVHSIEGYDISHVFNLRRPMVEFTWDQVMSHTNNVFEMESVDSVQKKSDDYGDLDDRGFSKYSDEEQSDITDLLLEGMKLHLKGQMLEVSLEDGNGKPTIWVPEWKGMLFLGTPVLPHLTAMFDTGLFINDLSLHDNSRDLVLAGTQTSAELKLALDQEQVKSKKLEDSMRKLDDEMRRTDELLYQMIPRTIADRLRAGEPAVDTCQVFNDVTILFSDVVGFTVICSRISPLQVVTMLNSMYSKFDRLCALNDVYKVETIGDAYVVVSGAPEEVEDHADRMADMALGMLETMTTLLDPSTSTHLQIRIGLNSGVVVAGVVGLKMPRYCLFGDTVNTAAKMEASSESMKIQMTETTMKHLQNNTRYEMSHRGLVEVKDKGKMNTFWLRKSATYTPKPGKVLPPARTHLRHPSAHHERFRKRTATTEKPQHIPYNNTAHESAQPASISQVLAPAVSSKDSLGAPFPGVDNRRNSLERISSSARAIYKRTSEAGLPEEPNHPSKKLGLLNGEETQAQISKMVDNDYSQANAYSEKKILRNPGPGGKISFPSRAEPRFIAPHESDTDSLGASDSDDLDTPPSSRKESLPKANASTNDGMKKPLLTRSENISASSQPNVKAEVDGIRKGTENQSNDKGSSANTFPQSDNLQSSNQENRKVDLKNTPTRKLPSIDSDGLRTPIFDIEDQKSPIMPQKKAPPPAKMPVRSSSPATSFLPKIAANTTHLNQRNENVPATRRSTNESERSVAGKLTQDGFIAETKKKDTEPTREPEVKAVDKAYRFPPVNQKPADVISEPPIPEIPQPVESKKEERPGTPKSEPVATEAGERSATSKVKPLEPEIEGRPETPKEKPADVAFENGKLSPMEPETRSVSPNSHRRTSTKTVTRAAISPSPRKQAEVIITNQPATPDLKTDDTVFPFPPETNGDVARPHTPVESRKSITSSTSPVTEKPLFNGDAKAPAKNSVVETMPVPVVADQASVDNSFDAAVDELLANEFARAKSKKVNPGVRITENGKPANGMNGKANGTDKTIIKSTEIVQRRAIPSCTCIIS